MSAPVLNPAATGTPSVADVLANRHWWRREHPHPHYVARNVFTREFFAAIEAVYDDVLSRGISDGADAHRFSRNMPNSDAYAWDFPPDVQGPLSLFYGREWHDLLATLFGVPATGDVNGALHHHHEGSHDGFVHGDLGVGWFSDQPRPDGINPMDLQRCSYTNGKPRGEDIRARETIRAVTMIYYVGNRGWAPGDGGQTGLYAAKDTPVDAPDAVAPPIDNSLLAFENTPHSWHSFMSTTVGRVAA